MNMHFNFLEHNNCLPAESAWVSKIFTAKAAKNGGIVRRKIETVRKLGLERQLLKAVRVRGFHMLESGGQYLIVCHDGHFKVRC